MTGSKRKDAPGGGQQNGGKKKKVTPAANRKIWGQNADIRQRQGTAESGRHRTIRANSSISSNRVTREYG
jgi:hypothetical protein